MSSLNEKDGGVVLNKIKFTSWKGKTQIRFKIVQGQVISTYELTCLAWKTCENLMLLENTTVNELFYSCSSVMPFDRWLSKYSGQVTLYPILKQVCELIRGLQKIGLSETKLLLHPSFICVEVESGRFKIAYLPINGITFDYDPVLFLKDLTMSSYVARESWYYRIKELKNLEDLFLLEKWLDSELQRKKSFDEKSHSNKLRTSLTEIPTDIDDEIPTGKYEADESETGISEDDEPITGIVEDDDLVTGISEDDDELVTGISEEDDEPETGVVEENWSHQQELRRATPKVTWISSKKGVIECNIRDNPFIIGRSKNKSHFCVEDNLKISNQHAMIQENNGKFYLSDYNSSNGTFVDGIRLMQNEKVELCDGMEFRLFNESFKFGLWRR